MAGWSTDMDGKQTTHAPDRSAQNNKQITLHRSHASCDNGPAL